MAVAPLCANCNISEPIILGIPQHFDSCARCHLPRYCSKECQIAHWKAVHKDVCSTVRSSLSVARSEVAAINMVFSFFNDSEISKTAHDISARMMVTKQSRGALVAKFESHKDVEKAILEGTLLRDFVGWTESEGFIDFPETDMHNIASYNPSNEFVVMVLVGQHRYVSGIIDIEDTYVEKSPFDLTLPYTKIMISDQSIAEDITGKKRRRKLAMFTRNCVKAMGIKKTPSAVKAKLDVFVDDGTNCHDIVKNGDGVAFAFAFGNDAQVFFDEMVVPLCATEKRVVMVLPHNIKIRGSFDVFEYHRGFRDPAY